MEAGAEDEGEMEAVWGHPGACVPLHHGLWVVTDNKYSFTLQKLDGIKPLAGIVPYQSRQDNFEHCKNIQSFYVKCNKYFSMRTETTGGEN